MNNIKLEKYKLGDVCDIYGRIGFRGYTVSDLVEKGEGAITLSPSNITDHTISFKDCDYISLYKYEESPEIKIFNGDIVFTKTGSTFGKCAIIDDLEEKTTINPQFVVFKKIKCNNRYLYYILRSDWFQKNIAHIVVGSTIPTMSQEDLKQQIIYLPCHSIQDKVAAALSKIDRKISLNKKTNRTLESMAKQLYDYWFVQFDFPDENGKPYKSSGGKMVWNEKLKREIPEGWEVKKLSDIANVTMGQSPEGSSYNDKGDGIIFYQGSTDFGEFVPSVRQYTNQPSRYAESKDILLSVRAPVGAMNITDKKCCIGRGLAALNSKDGYINYLRFSMEILKPRFDVHNYNGTTFGAITKDELYEMPVVFPNRNLICQYESKVNAMFDNQLLLSKQNQLLTSYRDFLLPMLMNGQVTVK